MQFTAKEIQDNWNRFMGIIKSDFSGDRQRALLTMYSDLEERAMFAPASSYEFFHNASPGGYVEHVLRVYDNSHILYKTFKDVGLKVDNFSIEELSFSALHHDLGKLGYHFEHGEHYIPNESKWHRENQGKLYATNPNIPKMDTADRTFFLLQHYGVRYSITELIAIKLTDGLYESANEPYLKGFNMETKLRNNLPYITHHADIMAYRYEFERWAIANNKFAFHTNGTDKQSEPKKVERPNKTISDSTIKSQTALDAFDALFKI